MTCLLHGTVIVKWGLRDRRSPQWEIFLGLPCLICLCVSARTDGLRVWFLPWVQDSLDLSSLSILLWSFLGKREHGGLSGAGMTGEKPYVWKDFLPKAPGALLLILDLLVLLSCFPSYYHSFLTASMYLPLESSCASCTCHFRIFGGDQGAT